MSALLPIRELVSICTNKFPRDFLSTQAISSAARDLFLHKHKAVATTASQTLLLTFLLLVRLDDLQVRVDLFLPIRVRGKYSHIVGRNRSFFAPRDM
jgi:hypothetical protein